MIRVAKPKKQKTVGMKIDGPRIKSWVERIEALIEERQALNGDIKDIYSEVTSGEHDAKAIRKLIARRALDPAALAEQDGMIAAYSDAVAGKLRAAEALASGSSTREAAKIGGISTGAAAALGAAQKSQEVERPALQEPEVAP